MTQKNMLKGVAIVVLFGAAHCVGAAPYIPPSSFSVSTVGFQVNGIAYDSTYNELLAAVPSSVGAGLGNTITALSNTGAVLRSTYVGSEPTSIGLSSDGTTAYVGMYGASLVRTYDVASGTAGSQFNLGSTTLGPNYARQILVSPTSNSTIVVALRNQGYSPSSNGVAVYSNGVAAPNALPAYQADVTSMAFGSGTTLYGYNGETSSADLYKMSVNGSGVSLLSDTRNGLGPGYGYTSIISSAGLIYGSNGAVYDPSVGYVIGTYRSPLANVSLLSVAPVSALGVVFAIDSSGKLVVFDQSTFTPITSYNIGSISPTYYGGASLLYLNNGSLAFRSGSNNLYLLSPVPEPSTYAMILASIGLVGFMARRRQQA